MIATGTCVAYTSSAGQAVPHTSRSVGLRTPSFVVRRRIADLAIVVWVAFPWGNAQGIDFATNGGPRLTAALAPD